MDGERIRALLIEANPPDLGAIGRMLDRAGGIKVQLCCVDRLSAGLEHLAAEDVDVVLLDLTLPDSRGLDTLIRMHARAPQVPMIVLSDLDDEALAARAVREGAQDCLVKGQLDGDLLVRAVRYAIERHRTECVLRRCNRELALLNRAGQALGSSLDVDRVLATVLEEVCHLLGAVAASVWLIDRKTGALVCRLSTGPHNDIVRGWRLQPGEGLAGWVAHSGESLIVSDIQTDERYCERVDQETGLNLRSILGVPLELKQKVIGVLQVVDRVVGRFDEADLALLEPLAAAAAVAIENAWLYEEANSLRAFNQNIVQSLEEGIVLEDGARRITFVNPKAAELLVCAPKDLMGRAWADIVAPDHEADVEAGGCGRNTGVVMRYETVLLTSCGQHLPVIVNARWLYDEGRLVGVLSAFTDITARKQAEEHVRRRNEELAALNAIAAAVGQSLDLHEVLNAALEGTLAALNVGGGGVEGGVIHLFDDGDRPVASTVGRDVSAAVLREVVEFAKKVRLRDVAESERPRPLHIPDLARTPGNAFSTAAHKGWHSLVGVPLRVKGTTLGFLAALSRDPGHPELERLPMLTAIGNQIGVAIENARLFEAVRAGRQQLQTLSRRLVHAQEGERRTIARELHDEIGQALTGLKLVLDMATSRPDQAAGDGLREALTVVDDLLARVRALSLDLRPTMLDDLGLLPALLWHCERYTVQTGVRMDLGHANLEGRRFPPEVETAAYRIVQEALTNVARHADVDETSVRLWVSREALRVQVSDDGRGFDPQAVSAESGGLIGMRERAALLGGDLTIESAPGSGTRLAARLPLHDSTVRGTGGSVG